MSTVSISKNFTVITDAHMTWVRVNGDLVGGFCRTQVQRGELAEATQLIAKMGVTGEL